MLNVALSVIGKGPEHGWLKKLAGRSVTFLTQVTDEEMPRHFGSSRGFIFPGDDDFGIVAVEALAAGTPVIAYKDGGALDYINKTTGIFFDKPTADSLASAMETFDKISFDHSAIAAEATKFSPAMFQQAMSNFINDHLKSRQAAE